LTCANLISAYKFHGRTIASEKEVDFEIETEPNTSKHVEQVTSKR